MPDSPTNLLYLVSAALFILGLKGLSNPRTAVQGNLLGALGMLLAIIVTLVDERIVDFRVILAGLVSGAFVGLVVSYRVPMTAMPQLVAVFNGFGGGASALAVGAALEEELLLGQLPSDQFTVAATLSGLVGGVTLIGSLVAFGKLQGLIPEQPLLLPGRHVINAVLFLASLGLGIWLVVDPSSSYAYWAMAGVAALLGLMLVLPIGGADMPVVMIALLNSYSGLAAAAHGFVVENSVLIVAGSPPNLSFAERETVPAAPPGSSPPGLIVEGPVVATSKGDDPTCCVATIRIKLISASSDPVTFFEEGTLVIYSDANNDLDLNHVGNNATGPRWSHTWLVGTPYAVDPGEVVELVADISALRTPLGSDSPFTLAVLPGGRPPVVIHRRTPLELEPVMELPQSVSSLPTLGVRGQ